MARTITCDRCGDDCGTERKQVSFVFGDGDMECVADDLCIGCCAELEEWVKAKPDKGTLIVTQVARDE